MFSKNAITKNLPTHFSVIISGLRGIFSEKMTLFYIEV